MGKCSCCFAPSKNKSGCSCNGGKSHKCLRLREDVRVAVTEAPQKLHTQLHMKALILNLDGVPSQRFDVVRCNKDLYANTNRLIISFSSNIVVSNESSKTNADRIASLAGLHLVREALGYAADVSSIMWCPDVWVLCDDEYTHSTLNKYLAVRLQHKGSDFRLGVISVHLRRGKNNITEKLQSVFSMAKTLRENGCHKIIIVGDFNARVENEHLDEGYRALIQSNTTLSGRCLDNVVTDMDNISTIIQSGLKLFSHFPIQAQFRK